MIWVKWVLIAIHTCLIHGNRCLYITPSEAKMIALNVIKCLKMEFGLKCIYLLLFHKALIDFFYYPIDASQDLWSAWGIGVSGIGFKKIYCLFNFPVIWYCCKHICWLYYYHFIVCFEHKNNFIRCLQKQFTVSLHFDF